MSGMTPNADTNVSSDDTVAKAVKAIITAFNPESSSSKLGLLRALNLQSAKRLINAEEHPGKELTKQYMKSMRNAYIQLLFELTEHLPEFTNVRRIAAWVRVKSTLTKAHLSDQGWTGSSSDLLAAAEVDSESDTLSVLEAAVSNVKFPGLSETLLAYKPCHQNISKAVNVFRQRLNRILSEFNLGRVEKEKQTGHVRKKKQTPLREQQQHSSGDTDKSGGEGDSELLVDSDSESSENETEELFLSWVNKREIVNEDIEGETTGEENNTGTESTVLNTVLATAYIKHSLEKNEQVQKDQNTLTFCSSAINTPQKGKLLPILDCFGFGLSNN